MAYRKPLLEQREIISLTPIKYYSPQALLPYLKPFGVKSRESIRQYIENGYVIPNAVHRMSGRDYYLFTYEDAIWQFVTVKELLATHSPRPGQEYSKMIKEIMDTRRQEREEKMKSQSR
jgi:hypothetical protein